MKETGHFPSATELNKRNLKSLVQAAYTYHDGFNNIRKKMGLKLFEQKKEYGTLEELTLGLKKMWKEHPEVKNQIPNDDWMRKNGYSNLGHSIYRNHGGFRKVREKLGIAQLNRYARGELKDWNNLTKELKKITKKYTQYKDTLPSTNWLRENGYYGIASSIIKYHGGFSSVRKKLGKSDLRRPNGCLNDFNYVLNSVKEIMDKNSLDNVPSYSFLYSINESSLAYAIGKYHGGIRKLRDFLGKDQIQIECGKWKNLEFTMNQAIDFMKREGYDHLPGNEILKKMNMSSLSTAISKYHGGKETFREKLNQFRQRPPQRQQLASLLEQYASGGGN